MLSQQFVSLCHELYRDPENNAVREELTQTISSFSRVQSRLHDSTRDISSADRIGNSVLRYMNHIDRTWTALQPKADLLLDGKSKQSAAAVKYIVSNDIRLAEAIGTILVLSEEQLPAADSDKRNLFEVYGIIGVLGRQMIRVQSVVKNVVRLNSEPANESVMNILMDDLAFFNEVHDELFDEESNPLLANSQSIAEELDKLDAIWAPINDRIDQFIDFNDFNIGKEQALKVIFDNRSELLEATNNLTEAFEQENRRIATWYKNFSLGVVSISLLSILIGWLSIIRPVLKVVRSVVERLTFSTDELAGLSKHLSKTSHTLSEADSIQASNIEVSSAAMDKITSMTQGASRKASASKKLILESRDALIVEGKFIEKVIVSMTKIVEMFVRIIKIIESVEELFSEIDSLPPSQHLTAAKAGTGQELMQLRIKRIEDLLEKTKAKVRTSHPLIDAINERLWEGDTQLNNLKTQFDELDDRFTEIVELMANIELSSQFQASKCTSVSEILHELGLYASHNVETAEFVAKSSDQLLDQTDRLKLVISQLQDLTGLRNGKD